MINYIQCNLAGSEEPGPYDGCNVARSQYVANALRIWQPEQNALKMLQGFPEDSPITQLRNQLDADDNGKRGHFLVSSDFDLRYSAALAARVRFLKDFSFAAYLPFYSMELKNVHWHDQTEDITDEDLRVKRLLNDDFFALVEELGGYQK